MRTFDTAVFLTLHEFLIEDLYQQHMNKHNTANLSQFKYLARSFEISNDSTGPLQHASGTGRSSGHKRGNSRQEKGDMIQACLNIVSVNSPTYDGTEASLSLYFNSLHLICNRETVVLLIDFATQIDAIFTRYNTNNI
jgi:hypothetical protein